MQKITCARVGYGKVAQLHEKKLQDCGVETIAIIDTDQQKQKQAERDGYRVFSSCAEATLLNPYFWDVCVSSNQHFNVIQNIISVAPHANILVEKPVCLLSEIPRLKRILSNFRGKLTVNENYSASTIQQQVKKIAFNKLQIQPEKIVVEFTKNRELDFASGRFTDEDLGALGYEGSHMLSIISEIGEQYLPGQIIEANFWDVLPRALSNVKRLRNQGTAYIHYKSKIGVEVELYTSMTGETKFKYPPFFQEKISFHDTKSKYRLMAIQGRDPFDAEYKIVGFFEPINQFKRCQGAIVITKNGEISSVIAPVYDDCMGTHLQHTIEYFKGERQNPYSVDAAIKVTEVLHTLVEKMYLTTLV